MGGVEVQRESAEVAGSKRTSANARAIIGAPHVLAPARGWDIALAASADGLPRIRHNARIEQRHRLSRTSGATLKALSFTVS